MIHRKPAVQQGRALFAPPVFVYIKIRSTVATPLPLKLIRFLYYIYYYTISALRSQQYSAHYFRSIRIITFYTQLRQAAK